MLYQAITLIQRAKIQLFWQTTKFFNKKMHIFGIMFVYMA